MPHLRVRGVSDQVVEKFSEGVNEELARLIQTTPDNFTIESIQTHYFGANAPYPFIEVYWFERTKEIKEQVAQFLTARMRSLVGETDIAVVFWPIEKTNYFENGVHF